MELIKMLFDFIVMKKYDLVNRNLEKKLSKREDMLRAIKLKNSLMAQIESVDKVIVKERGF